MLIYNKLLGSNRAEKVKQLGAVLISQQQFFTLASESNKIPPNQASGPANCQTWQNLYLLLKKKKKSQERLLALGHFHIMNNPDIGPMI